MTLSQSGNIVYVGIVVCRVSNPRAGSYCARMAVVHTMSMSNGLRLELRQFWINVLQVLPVAVK